MDLELDLEGAKGPRDETPANRHVLEERSGRSGPYGPYFGVNEGILGHTGLTKEIGPQGPRRSTKTPEHPLSDDLGPGEAATFDELRKRREANAEQTSRPEPLTPEQVSKYQRLRREGMKEDLAIAEVRRAKA